MTEPVRNPDELPADPCDCPFCELDRLRDERAELMRLNEGMVSLCRAVIHALAQWDESDGPYVPGIYDVQTAGEYAERLAKLEGM